MFVTTDLNILILAAEVMTSNQAIQAGRNPEMLKENKLYNEQIVEVEPIGTNGGNIVWEWNFKDHFIQDLDISKDNFGDVANNPQLLDINFTNGKEAIANWLHINSIQYNKELDQIIISARTLSEIYIIDHSTTTAEAASSSGGTYGKGGDLLYRWGNPQSYKQGAESDRKLYGQHYPHWIPSTYYDGGKIIVFNNGDNRSPEFSEVYTLKLPELSPGVYDYTKGTSYNPTTPDYIYANESNFYSRIVSSAQRLPNGNTLICQGSNGIIFEIDDSENIVWKYISPANNNNGNIASQGDSISGLINITFRAIKYAFDHPAFNGKNLTPGDPIELNPQLSECDNLSIEDNIIQNIKIYPNPTTNNLYIKTSSKISNIEIYNTVGTLVISTKESKAIKLKKLKSGIYFIKIKNEGRKFIKKIIKK